MNTPRKPIIGGTKIITNATMNNTPIHLAIHNALFGADDRARKMASIYKKILTVSNSPRYLPTSNKPSRGCIHRRISLAKGNIIGHIAGNVDVYWVQHSDTYWIPYYNEYCTGAIAPYVVSEFELDNESS